MRTVRHGHAPADNPHPPTASRRVLRRPATTATGRPIPTTAVRTNRRNVRSRLTTTTAVIRNSALTIRRPRARIQRREPIPRRAAAIQLRLAPTPHLAAVIAVAVEEAAAVAVVAIAVVVAVEAAAAAVVVRGRCRGGWRRR